MPRYLPRYSGKYVAIDMASDGDVLTANTPEELHEQIQAKGLRNVAVMRAPTEDEPLFVWRTMGAKWLRRRSSAGAGVSRSPTRPRSWCGVVRGDLLDPAVLAESAWENHAIYGFYGVSVFAEVGGAYVGGDPLNQAPASRMGGALHRSGAPGQRA